MNKYITKVAIPAAALLLTCLSAPGQINLTDISIFSASSTGGYDGNPSSWDYWNSRPGDAYANIWIQNSGGTFLNGPTDPAVRPNISMILGESSYRLSMSPGADWSYFGVNLFFNNSSTPSISAYCPLRTADGATSFWANSSAQTLLPTSITYVQGAGTLSFVSGDKRITLTDFYLARPAVYGLDLVRPATATPDGANDYIAKLSLKVEAVPEPGLSLWGLGLVLTCMVKQYRRRNMP